MYSHSERERERDIYIYIYIYICIYIYIYMLLCMYPRISKTLSPPVVTHLQRQYALLKGKPQSLDHTLLGGSRVVISRLVSRTYPIVWGL